MICVSLSLPTVANVVASTHLSCSTSIYSPRPQERFYFERVRRCPLSPRGSETQIPPPPLSPYLYSIISSLLRLSSSSNLSPLSLPPSPAPAQRSPPSSALPRYTSPLRSILGFMLCARDLCSNDPILEPWILFLIALFGIFELRVHPLRTRSLVV